MKKSFLCQRSRPLFCTLFPYSPLRRRGTHFWRTVLPGLGGLLIANPLPPTPFRTSDRSCPGKPNKTKGRHEKFMNMSGQAKPRSCKPRSWKFCSALQEVTFPPIFLPEGPSSLTKLRGASAVAWITFQGALLQNHAPHDHAPRLAFSEYGVFFCELGCFSLGMQAQFISNIGSDLPPRKVHEPTFLWFGLPERILIFCFFALLYFACSPEEFCEYFVSCLPGCIEKWRGFLVNCFCSPSPTKRSTRTPRKIREKFGAKFGAKFGMKIRKIRETFVLQLF